MFKNGLYLIFTVILIFVLQLFIMASHFNYSAEKTWHHFNTNFTIMLWNIVILFLFYCILIAITNRQFLTWVSLSSIMILFSIANYLKLKYRTEPLLPSDLTMIGQLKDIISYLTKKDIVISVVSLIGFFIVIALTMYFDKYKVFTNMKLRIVHALVVLATAITLFSGNNLDNNFLKVGIKFGYSSQFWSMPYHYFTNGPLVSFLSITDVIAMDKMKFVEEDIDFLKEYQIDTTTNKDHDEILIYILGESFIDPLRIPGVKMNKDPIPFIRSIMDTYTSGLLYQTTSGGGTSKTEYEALTSFSNAFYHKSVSTPYQYPVPNLDTHPMLNDLFENSVAIHTLHAKLYRRVDVFETFGFDRFKYLDSPTDDLIYKEKIENHRNISDMSGVKEVLDTIDTIPKDESGFIYLATVQNHSPYDKSYYSNVEFIVENDYPPEVKSQFEAFSKGLNETDKAIQYLIEQVEKIDRNVTIVFFGDHYPPFAKQLVEPKENYKTDYFVYQNYQKIKLHYPLISTNNLTSVALKNLNIPISPFYKFMDEVLGRAHV